MSSFLAVTTNASWKYDFLPLTVCAIDPRVTTSLVSYSGGTINTTVLSSQSLGSSNSNLTQFLAAIIHRQSRTTQGLTTNSIGDALYSIYVSASNNSTSPDDVTNLLLRELVSVSRFTCCPTEQTRTVSGTILAGCHRVLRNGAFLSHHPTKSDGRHPHYSSCDLHFLYTRLPSRPRHGSL